MFLCVFCSRVMPSPERRSGNEYIEDRLARTLTLEQRNTLLNPLSAVASYNCRSWGRKRWFHGFHARNTRANAEAVEAHASARNGSRRDTV